MSLLKNMSEQEPCLKGDIGWQIIALGQSKPSRVSPTPDTLQLGKTTSLAFHSLICQMSRVIWSGLALMSLALPWAWKVSKKWMMMLSQDRLQQRAHKLEGMCVFLFSEAILFWIAAHTGAGMWVGLGTWLRLWEAELPVLLSTDGRDYTGCGNGSLSPGEVLTLLSWKPWQYWQSWSFYKAGPLVDKSWGKASQTTISSDTSWTLF